MMPRTLIAALFRRLSREDPWALAAFAATPSLGVVVLFNAFPLYAVLAAGTEMADGRRAQVDFARMGLELTRQEVNAHAEFHILRDFSPEMFLLGVLLPVLRVLPDPRGKGLGVPRAAHRGLRRVPGTAARDRPVRARPRHPSVFVPVGRERGAERCRRPEAAKGRGSSPGRPTST